MYAKLQLHPPYDFWEEDLFTFFENLPIMLLRQPNKLSDFDKVIWNMEDYSINMYVKKVSLMRQQKMSISTFSLSVYGKYNLP